MTLDPKAHAPISLYTRPYERRPLGRPQGADLWLDPAAPTFVPLAEAVAHAWARLWAGVAENSPDALLIPLED